MEIARKPSGENRESHQDKQTSRVATLPLDHSSDETQGNRKTRDAYTGFICGYYCGFEMVPVDGLSP